MRSRSPGGLVLRSACLKSRTRRAGFSRASRAGFKGWWFGCVIGGGLLHERRQAMDFSAANLKRAFDDGSAALPSASE